MISVELLKERYDEELRDVQTYNKLAEDCHTYSQIFRDIACEENNHAKQIQYILDHMELSD